MSIDSVLYAADTWLHNRRFRRRGDTEAHWSWRWICDWHDRRVLRD